MDRRCLLMCLSVSLTGLGHDALAQVHAAQTHAARPIRLIVSLRPGSAIDFSARIIAPYLSSHLGAPVIVENKSGANGVIGMQDLLRATPDGNGMQMPLRPRAPNPWVNRCGDFTN